MRLPKPTSNPAMTITIRLAGIVGEGSGAPGNECRDERHCDQPRNEGDPPAAIVRRG